jgi:hypothetical protein
MEVLEDLLRKNRCLLFITLRWRLNLCLFPQELVLSSAFPNQDTSSVVRKGRLLQVTAVFDGSWLLHLAMLAFHSGTH